MVLARELSSSFEVFLVPMFASDTPTLRRAANLGAAVAWHLPRSWDLLGEVVAGNRDAPDGVTAWAVGLVKRVPGHEFLIYLGNSRATTVDLLAGSDLPGGFASGEVRLGFNITRRFPE